jgi:hypothetical protein
MESLPMGASFLVRHRKGNKVKKNLTGCIKKERIIYYIKQYLYQLSFLNFVLMNIRHCQYGGYWGLKLTQVQWLFNICITLNK